VVVCHELHVVHGLPINPMLRYIVTLLQPIQMPSVLILTIETAGAIFNHTEKVHFLGGLLTFPSNLKFVVVPCLCPCESVFIDLIQEQVVEEPDVRRVVCVKPLVCFQVCKEVLPLPTKPFGNIIPNPLDATVVDTPGQGEVVNMISTVRNNDLTCLPQI